MNILKFNISSNFGYFQDKVNIRNNISYPSIHRPSILGIIGAILGIDGFAKLKENGLIKYIDELSSIEVGILINSEISYTKVTTNDSTSLNITNRDNRVTQKYETILNEPNFDIYLRIEDDVLFNQVFSALKNKEYVFEPTLGKSYFFATIKDVQQCDVSEKENIELIDDDLVYSYSLFPSQLVPDMGGETHSELFVSNDLTLGRDFTLPVSSEKTTGQYNNYEHYVFNNFMLFDDIKDDSKYVNIDDKLIYFSS